MDSAMTHYTMPEATEAVIVPVAAFRDAIEHLETKTGRDYAACVNAAERAKWACVTREVGATLINMVCKRATTSDMDRRERAIDRSASMLSKVEGL